MALTAKSLFLYNFEVTLSNRSIDFVAVGAGPTLLATLTLGFYSLGSLLVEVKRAMEAVDTANTYSITADRTVAAGLENRVSIATSGGFLSILFATGPRSVTAADTLLGFSGDQTGSTSYTGTSSAGTVLVSELVGYSFTPPEMENQIFGNVNISTSGKKEAIVFSLQRFFQVNFKYEPTAKVVAEWFPLNVWMIQQRLIEFTPEVTSPTVFIEATLESHVGNNKGLGFKMKEMLPEFPEMWTTGLMKFRKTNT